MSQSFLELKKYVYKMSMGSGQRDTNKNTLRHSLIIMTKAKIDIKYQMQYNQRRNFKYNEV